MINQGSKNSSAEQTFSLKLPTTISLSEILLEDVNIILPELTDVDRLRIEYQIESQAQDQIGITIKDEIVKKISKQVLKYKTRWSQFINEDAYSNRLAYLYKEIGNLPEALNLLKKRYESSLSEPEVNTRYLEYLFLNGDHEIIKKLILEKDLSSSYSGSLLMSSICIKTNDLNKALDYANSALQINPLDNRSLKLIAIISILSSDYNKALKYLKELLRDENHNSNLYRYSGICYYLSGNLEKSQDYFIRALNISPTNKNALMNLYDACSSIGNLEPFIHYSNIFLSISRNDLQVIDRLSISLLNKDAIDKAIEILRKGLAIEPIPYMYHNLGIAYFRKKNLKGAIASIFKSIELTDPKSDLTLLAFANLFRIYRTLNQSKKALDLFKLNKDLIIHHPSPRYQGECLIQLAWILDETNEKDDSIKMFELIVTSLHTSEKSKSLAYMNLTSRYTRRKFDYSIFVSIAKRAEEFIKTSKVSSEAKKTIHNNLMYGFLSHNHIDEAKKYIVLLSKYVHEVPYITATFGLYHIRSGNIKKGTELYQEAISLYKDTNDKTICKQKMNLELGRFHIKSGNFLEAKKSLQKAIRYKSEDPEYFITATDLLNSISKEGISFE